MVRERNRLISGTTQLDSVGHVAFNGLVSATGLIAYYKLDETYGTTVYDSVGTYNGTLNGPTINQTGKINKCYSFDGSNDYVNCNALISSVLTLTVWFKSSYSGTAEQFIICKDNGTVSGMEYRIYLDGSGHVRANFGNHINEAESTNTYRDGNWHFVVAVKNSSTTILYVDGVAQTITGSTSTQTTIVSTIIGYRLANNYASFNGLIDEVGIWSRALTSDEITALYNNGAGLTY